MKTIFASMLLLLAAVPGVVRAQEQQVRDPQVFTIVEEMPQYPGGEEAMFKFIGEHIKYPAEALDAGQGGVVYVTFVVGRDGAIQDARVLRGIGYGCDEEAVRVVRMMPNWTPGRQRGEAVLVQYNLPIRFTFDADGTEKERKGKG